MREILIELARRYESEGPVFQIGPPDDSVTVLAGPKATGLLTAHGGKLFRNRETYTHLVGEMGGDFIAAMDGAAHRRLRSVMQPAFTFEATAGYVPSMYSVILQQIRDWKPGQLIDLVNAFRHLVINQTSYVMSGYIPGPFTDTIARYYRTAVASTVGRYDARELANPDYIDAREAVMDLMRRVLHDHEQAGAGSPPDYIDRLLLGNAGKEREVQENELLPCSLVPFVSGVDTVTFTSSYMFWHILKDTELKRRIEVEVDDLFLDGPPSLEALWHSSILRFTMFESLRLYSLGPPATRRAAETFEFEGHRIDRDQKVMVGTTISHFVSHFFPLPLTFDPDRHAPPRSEYRRPGAFAPFFKGPHACIGDSVGQAQIMLTVASLLHHLHFEPAFDSSVGSGSWSFLASRIVGPRVPLPGETGTELYAHESTETAIS